MHIEPGERSRGVAIPRLVKLLWLLLECAGSISEEMRHLKRAAQGLEIAPGIRLSDHLYTNAIDYEKWRVHGRLRATVETWPPEFAPQAFLLLEASEVTSSEVVTGLGTVEIRNRIQHTGIIRAEVEPPFLVLAVVGEHSRREGYLALLYEHSGLECKFALQILQSDDTDYLELRSIERERLGQDGLVVSMAVNRVTPEALISEARRILE